VRDLRRSSRRILAVWLLAAALLVPRFAVLDRVVTPDEPSWLVNAGGFYRALSQGDYGDTYRIEHPGVTTMWIGMGAYLWAYPDYPQDSPRQFDWWESDQYDAVLNAHDQDPMDILIPARVGMMLVFSLTMLLAFFAAIRRFSFSVALLGFAIIAFDPMFLALSGLLHVDALLSAFTLVSLLALWNYWSDGRRRDLIVSSIALGLAVLTKSPALFLLPFGAGIGLWMALEWHGVRPSVTRARLVTAVRTIAIWAALGLMVFVVLWPAMWTDPIGTGPWIVRGSAGHALDGHESALFFNGDVYEGDPGWNFYPLAYFWRASPVVLIGLILFTLSLIPAFRRFMSDDERRTALMLGGFSLGFMCFMTLGAKKFDRYLLPIFGPLDIVAALGWVSAIVWLIHVTQARRALVFAACVAGLAVIQAAVALSTAPYYFSYYNPLLGGTAAAADVLMIGWGEGLDGAAEYLNDQPDAADLRVATSAWGGTFSYFFDGTTVPGRYNVDKADYYVLYYNQVQRRAVPEPFMQMLETHPVVYRSELSGLEYLRVYDLRRQVHIEWLPMHVDAPT